MPIEGYKTITIPDELIKDIDRLIITEGYKSRTEVVSAGINALKNEIRRRFD